uniref:Uncharacterized protein n=1 Tax=Ixodes ricinus TaxID=34613 RepID=A0A6B0U3H3_IXORI
MRRRGFLKTFSNSSVALASAPLIYSTCSSQQSFVAQRSWAFPTFFRTAFSVLLFLFKLTCFLFLLAYDRVRFL